MMAALRVMTRIESDRPGKTSATAPRRDLRSTEPDVDVPTWPASIQRCGIGSSCDCAPRDQIGAVQRDLQTTRASIVRKDAFVRASPWRHTPSADWATTHQLPQSHGFLPAARENGATDPGVVIESMSLQPKLTISAPGDSFEREADDVADRVMRIAQPSQVGSPSAPIQFKHGPCDDSNKKTIQSTRSPCESPTSALNAKAAVQAASSGGTPLSMNVRSYFEARFNRDFSQVRIHADSDSAEGARAVQARAYTVGRDIVFGSGQYSPGTAEGKRLLAHELTHVVQQNRAESPGRSLINTDPAGSAEVGMTETGAARSKTSMKRAAIADGPSPTTSIQRFHHDSSCTSSDLTAIVWPGDYAMRLMIAKAIRVLSAKPIDPKVTALFPKYFMTATPPVADILAVYNAIQAVITRNDYTYECEHECGSEEAAYVRHRLRYLGINPNIHLCINWMSGYSQACNASLIVHELSHYASHLDGESPACGTCSTDGCPVSLSPGDALDNTYSFADFAFELNSIPV